MRRLKRYVVLGAAVAVVAGPAVAVTEAVTPTALVPAIVAAPPLRHWLARGCRLLSVLQPGMLAVCILRVRLRRRWKRSRDDS